MNPSEIIGRIRKAGLTASNAIRAKPSSTDTLEPLDQRLREILSLTAQLKQNPGNMLFFVMYDIESNKVRNLVAKYLIRQGCFRIQHSIYLANLSPDKCNEIKNDLAEVQAVYDNNDSILVVPISSDYLKAMKVIGKLLNVDVIMHSQNTLFF
ncbi:MAG: CRISPR-associated endonuclease Cas2 [Bacteroidales bacterium]|nr:CRISPR-associated endonuclease Cas2 [Bacteroidales bacterium]